jgi:hypothetical protein
MQLSKTYQRSCIIAREKWYLLLEAPGDRDEGRGPTALALLASVLGDAQEATFLTTPEGSTDVVVSRRRDDR